MILIEHVSPSHLPPGDTGGGFFYSFFNNPPSFFTFYFNSLCSVVGNNLKSRSGKRKITPENEGQETGI